MTDPIIPQDQPPITPWTKQQETVSVTADVQQTQVWTGAVQSDTPHSNQDSQSKLEQTTDKLEKTSAKLEQTTAKLEETSKKIAGEPVSHTEDVAVMTKQERNEIGDDLKKSFRDIGRIPYLLVLPLITLIQSQYEKIPETNRQGFARMVGDIKQSGKEGIGKLKEWMTNMFTKNKEENKAKPESEEVAKNIPTDDEKTKAPPVTETPPQTANAKPESESIATEPVNK